MNIKLYYSKDDDCMQMVRDGILEAHDEGISKGDFLKYFYGDVKSVEDLKVLTAEKVLEIYQQITNDFKENSTKEEIDAYFEYLHEQEIRGELLLDEDFEPEIIGG